MTTRRKIKLRAYDYMEGHRIVVDALKAAGESVKLDSTENSMVDHAVEIAADQGYTNAQAIQIMQETAAYIVRTRKETLFPVWDERDNMGDESAAPVAVEEARRAVA